MRHPFNKNHQQGLTLIELMIAMLLGVFLVGGILQIFISTKQSYRMHENLSRLQENGRYAIDFIARDIRMTGYWGCLIPSSPDVDIAGTNDNGDNTDSIDDGTDTITLQGAFVLTPIGVCGTAANAASSCCKTDPSLTANICPPANIAICSADPSSTVSYRISNGVLQKNNTGVFNDLIEGIENMQILYGEDTAPLDGTANYYVSVDNVVNMANVVSIRVSLLVRTLDDNLASQTLLYNYNDATGIDPGDLRIRRVFTATIAVRNRLI